jgi:DNA polymerase I
LHQAAFNESIQDVLLRLEAVGVTVQWVDNGVDFWSVVELSADVIGLIDAREREIVEHFRAMHTEPAQTASKDSQPASGQAFAPSEELAKRAPTYRPDPALDHLKLAEMPGIIFCKAKETAELALAEMFADAGVRPVSIDIETMPDEEAAGQIETLSRQCAHVDASIRAARKAKAPSAALEANKRRLAIDLAYARTAALDPHRGAIRTLQIYGGGPRVAVIDVVATGPRVLQALHGRQVIAHNYGFEFSFLSKLGIEPSRGDCTAQLARLLLGPLDGALETAAPALLGIGPTDKTEQTDDWSAENLSDAQIVYAAIDAVLPWRIAEKCFPRLGPQIPAYVIQRRVLPPVTRMQARGFLFDVDRHAKLMAELVAETAELGKAFAEACVSCGLCHIQTPPSTDEGKRRLLEDLLTDEELAMWARTAKARKLSVAAGQLRHAGHYDPVAVLAKIIKNDTLRKSFGYKLQAFANPRTGRIHSSYMICGTESGRASCNSPNVQQIPADERLRGLFRAADGDLLVLCDYGSMELRAAGCISGDRKLLKVFERGLDLHAMTASTMLGKPPIEVSPEERKVGKTTNFGAVYGQGARGLQNQLWKNLGLWISLDEAAAWQDAFARSYPQFAEWRKDHAARCDLEGKIVIGKDARLGRGRIYPRSRLPKDGFFFTRCCNLPIQGVCADIAMNALASIDEALSAAGIPGGPVAWLHDEFVLEVPENYADRSAALLRECMVNAFIEVFPDAPTRKLAEPHIAVNWADAKQG